MSVLRSVPLRCSIRADMYYSHEYAVLGDMDAMLGLVSASWRAMGHTTAVVGTNPFNLSAIRL